MAKTLPKEKHAELMSTMFSRPLSQEEVDTLLTLFPSLSIVYHDANSGLDFEDSLTQEIVLSLRGRGLLDTIPSDTLTHVISTYPTHATYLYELFSQGIITCEQHDIEAQVRSEYTTSARTLEDMTSGVLSPDPEGTGSAQGNL